MRRYILLLTIILLVISQQTFAGKKLKVLFIGNSYTFVNNLPQVTHDIATSMGDTLIFDSYTVGGYTFYDHFHDALCANKIHSAKWDYVVLQEQSQLPSQRPSDFAGESYYWAQQLDTMIAANDPCTKNIFYMTWGYKNGDAATCANYPSWQYSCTYQGMDSLTNLRYRGYADTAVLALVYGSTLNSGSQYIRHSLVSPVGAVRHYIRDHYPTIELYQPDESHPTEAGTYAGACTFYTILFHKDPTSISYSYVLNSTDAGNIRNAAKLVTYDSLGKWYVGTDLRAQFTFTSNTGNAYSFTNTSTAATSYLWNFGDGSTSVSPNPSHTYANNGSYIVKLVAFGNSCSDTTFAAINTSPAGIENLTAANSNFAIWPNPASNLLNISSSKTPAGISQLSIVNTLGQEVYFNKNISASQQIDVSGWSNGVYFIVFTNGDNIVYKYKLLKQ